MISPEKYRAVFYEIASLLLSMLRTLRGGLVISHLEADKIRLHPDPSRAIASHRFLHKVVEPPL
jgi:hypothetical protein